LKGQCHAIWHLYKNLEGVFHFFPLVATDGDDKDGNGLKFEKAGQFFQTLMLLLQKIVKKFIMVISPL